MSEKKEEINRKDIEVFCNEILGKIPEEKKMEVLRIIQGFVLGIEKTIS